MRQACGYSKAVLVEYKLMTAQKGRIREPGWRPHLHTRAGPLGNGHSASGRKRRNHCDGEVCPVNCLVRHPPTGRLARRRCDINRQHRQVFSPQRRAAAPGDTDRKDPKPGVITDATPMTESRDAMTSDATGFL